MTHPAQSLERLWLAECVGAEELSRIRDAVQLGRISVPVMVEVKRFTDDDRNEHRSPARGDA